MSDGEEFTLVLPSFTLEGGARLRRHRLVGWCGGGRRGGRPVDPARPTVLVVHALTGDHRVDRWWEPLVGSGRVLDTERMQVLCFNNLGSCYGSSGSRDGAWSSASGEERPVTITTWDQARSILLALDRLGVERVRLATGGSVGAMIVLCLAVLAPTRFERIMPIAGAAAASPWVVGFNHIAREMILLDGTRGLALARQLAMMTYRAEPGLERTQRRRGETGASGLHPGTPYPIEEYLEYQGELLRARFDGASYLTLLAAMDHHDLERAPGSPEARESWRLTSPWGLERVTASTLAVGITSDNLFPPTQMQTLVGRLARPDRWAQYVDLVSPHGHDAFLIEWSRLAVILRRALMIPLTLITQPTHTGD